MSADVRLVSLRGTELAPQLDAVAALRIAVFREWPYLYDGDLGYEREYLGVYARAASSVVVLALDGARVVGASTALALADESPDFQAPFRAHGFPLDEVFYFGESVLLREYRGAGIGGRFFDAREAHARSFPNIRWTGFCAVDRAADDPRRPPGHIGNESLWNRRGYTRRPELAMRLPWREIGEPVATPKTLTFWLREWTA
jgi:GNAT superfamily N-acetyltransferase